MEDGKISQLKTEPSSEITGVYNQHTLHTSGKIQLNSSESIQIVYTIFVSVHYLSFTKYIFLNNYY